MSLTLSREELRELTGGLTQPAAQLRELHLRGFFRARRSKLTGQVILEREHYDAVTAGAIQAPKAEPRLRQPKLRVV